MFGSKLSRKLKKSEKGFTDIDIENHWWYCGNSNDNRNFERGDVRKFAEEFYEKNSEYLFLNVVANPGARSLMKNYCSKFNWIKNETEGYSEYKKARTKNEKESCMQFNRKFMEEYLNTLDFLLEKDLGKNNFSSFPIVNGNLNQHWGSENWPQIYILKNEKNSDKFKEFVNSLNGNKAYQYLKKREHPQNYNVGKINLLRDKKILPLITLNDEWKVDSENLKNAINFLVQFNLTEHWTGDCADGDM